MSCFLVELSNKKLTGVLEFWSNGNHISQANDHITELSETQYMNLSLNNNQHSSTPIRYCR